MTTTRVVQDSKSPTLLRRKLQLEVVRGADAGRTVVCEGEEINIGKLPSNNLALNDSSVSRYHMRIAPGRHGFVITDLDSTNGTFISGLRIREVAVDGPIDIDLGDSLVRVTPLDDQVEVPLHPSDRLGPLVGRSPQMRALFAQVVALAQSNATVLIDGDTGTGKELLAEEIHKRSLRKDAPFIIVDCGSLPDNLVESELFGHVRGAFTGAAADRAGAFELAHGGTLFLDEIGEMTASAQPRLLRVLESRQVKRVGSDRYRQVDVRIIAATNRDLRLSVNEGAFRSDLYFRLSVVRLHLPSLRERPEDIEPLARHFLEQFSHQVSPSEPEPKIGAETMQRLVSHRWPGNIRELRNFMQRVAVMAHSGMRNPPLPDAATMAHHPKQTPDGNVVPAVPLDTHLPYKESKARWIDHFETTYVSGLLERNDGNVAAAAREAGVDRTYLFRLIRKYGLRH